MDRGHLHELTLSSAAHITSDKPILVAQYANSALFDDSASDPFMMLVPAVSQYLGQYTITTEVDDLPSNFVNLTVPDAALDSIALNGQLLSQNVFTPIGSSGFSAAQIALEPGSHTMQGPLAFGALVYGFGTDESYGYPAGIALELDPPLVIGGLELTPETATRGIGQQHFVTAQVVDQNSDPLPGISVEFVIAGANEASGFAVSDAAGNAAFTYEGINLGTDTISATVSILSDVVQATWIADPVTIVVEEPDGGTAFDAGSLALVTGQVTVDQGATITSVLINGSPVATLDALGNFFTQVNVAAGDNTYDFLAIDSLGQTASTRLTLLGLQPQEGPDAPELFSNVVSASFAAQYQRTSFNEKNDTLFADLNVRNVGSFAIDAPLLVAVDHISNPAVGVRAFDGFTDEGLPYFNLTALVDDGTLDPGEATSSFTLSFFNPNRIQFTYDLVYFSQLNDAPQFTSVPDQEAVVDRPYSYTVGAVDADGDPLTFTLRGGPSDASMDSSTGLLTWTPTNADLGSHSFIIDATDDRGSSTRQQFDVVVLALPPNRPPVFTSAPVVEANVAGQYHYAAVANDADGDLLQYSLLESPAGMTVAPGDGRSVLDAYGPTARIS